MTEIKRRRSWFEKFSWWIISLVFTTIITAYLTWNVTQNLTNNEKTKVYDYTYMSDQSNTEKTVGSVDCWVNGIGNRSDVYKCSSNKSIFTPCFRDMKDLSDKVKCPDTPNNDTDAKIYNANFTKDTEPLMSRYSEEPLPWYIYLTTGEECRFVSGATYTVANRRMDFICKDSSVTLYLPAQKSEDIYSIGCMKNHRLEECNIREMWR